MDRIGSLPIKIPPGGSVRIEILRSELEHMLNSARAGRNVALNVIIRDSSGVEHHKSYPVTAAQIESLLNGDSGTEVKLNPEKLQ